MPGANKLNSVRDKTRDCDEQGDVAVVELAAEDGSASASTTRDHVTVSGGTSAGSVIEGAAVGLVVVERQQGITQANSLARKLLGVPATDNNCLDDVHRALDEIGLGEVLLAGDTAPAGQREFMVKNKQDKLLKITCSVIAEGETGCKVITITDNTLRQQHNEAMTEFIASISHELRTPLTTIQNSASNILAGVTGKITPKTTQYLENMLKECGRLAGLVNDLLDMAKLDAGKMPINRSPADLTRVLLKVVDTFRPLAMEKNLELQFSINQDISPVYVDQQRIHQVFTNILKNAVRYTDAGGKIIVHLREEENNVTAVVEDNGIGIAPELLPNVFNKFYQISRKAGPGYNGCGLGLAICKELVGAHGGRIWVESEVGTGSKFFVSLPKIDPAVLLRKHIAGLVDYANAKGTGFAILRGAVRYKAPLSPPLTRAAGTIIGEALSMKREVVCGPGDLIIRTGEEEVIIVLTETDDSFLRSVHQRLQKIMATAIERNSLSNLPIVPITNLVTYPHDAGDIDQLLLAARKEPAARI
jgi:signal transduction histidine kinase